MAEEFYSRTEISLNELKFAWPSTLVITSLIARRQPIAASVQKRSDSVVKSVSTACRRQSRCVGRNRNDQLGYHFELIYYV